LIRVSPYVVILFTLYTAFVLFAMMNVVTSYFVENTIRAVELSRGSNLAIALWDEFFKNDDGDENQITPEIFYDHLHTPQMNKFLQSLEMTADTCQEYQLFALLDTDGSGNLGVDELIDGCLRLRGNARQIDLSCLRLHLMGRLDMLQDSLGRIEDSCSLRGNINDFHNHQTETSSFALRSFEI